MQSNCCNGCTCGILQKLSMTVLSMSKVSNSVVHSQSYGAFLLQLCKAFSSHAGMQGTWCWSTPAGAVWKSCFNSTVHSLTGCGCLQASSEEGNPIGSLTQKDSKDVKPKRTRVKKPAVAKVATTASSTADSPSMPHTGQPSSVSAP